MVCVAVEKRSFAFHLIGNDRPAIACVSRNHVQVKVKDRLEGDFTVTEEEVDPLAAEGRAS